MDSKNMLSAKNVRVHGMQDTRWTKNDKLLQYKGVLKLHYRDQKITHADKAVAERKHKFELKSLKKGIEASRNKLQALVIGDKQQMRNALAEHKHMQLAYQELPALRVIDHIYQNNFTKRKQLDMLNYRTKEQTQILIDFKLSKAIWEDRIKYQQFDMPWQETAERITGKVQDAILKKEAAIVVHEAYVKIIDIMKKDALYYDAILEDLKDDAKSQAQCLIRATQLGQLAMEYLDDRKEEFLDLEVTVKRDLKLRLEDLAVVTQTLEDIQGTMKNLIRKDSDINCGLVALPPEFSNKDLAIQVQDVENLLYLLESVTGVKKFENIYPYFIEQLRQKRRLEELQQRFSIDYDTLQNKVNHASTMKHLMENTMLETTNFYMDEKKRISEELDAQRERKKQIDKRLETKNRLLANIDICLKELDSMCEIIEDDRTKKPHVIDQVMLPSGTPLYREKCPDPGEFDGRKIIATVFPKIQKLIAAASQIPASFRKEHKTDALVAYANLISNLSKICDLEITLVEEKPLIDETETTADQVLVPTREEIKNTSEAIYKQCSVDPDLLPLLPAKK